MSDDPAPDRPQDDETEPTPSEEVASPADSAEPEAPDPEPEEASDPEPQPAPSAGDWWEAGPDEVTTPTPAPTPSGRKRALASSGSISARQRFARERSNTPLVLAGVAGVGLLLGLGWLATRPADPGPAAQTSPSAPATPSETPAPRPTLVTLPQSQVVLAELAAEGRFELALELLAGCDPELRELGAEVFPELEARYRRGAELQAELSAALAEGPTSRRLLQLILDSERYAFDSDLQALGFVQRFQAQAMQLLGEQAYEDLVVFGLPPEPVAEAPAADDDDDELEFVQREALTIEARGDDERRARFAAEAEAAGERLAAARERIETRSASHDAALRAEAERALGNTLPVGVPPFQGEPSWRGRVMAYDAEGFVLQGPRTRKRFTWVDAPATTACDVLERGVADDDPDGLYRLLRRALAGALFDRAAGYHTRLRALAPERALPDVASFRALGRVFHGAGTAGVDSLDVVYAFDDPAEREDWIDVGPAQNAVSEGALSLGPFRALGLDFARVAHAGLFQELACEVTPAAITSRVIVAVGDQVVRCGADAVVLHTWGEEPDPEDVPAGASGLALDQPFTVALDLDDDGALTVQVRQGDALLLDETLAYDAEGFFVMLGAQGGEARFDAIRLSGKPQSEWFTQVEAALPFTIERELETWELRHGPRPVAADALPPTLAETSAEDAVGLEGIPADAQTSVASARRWLSLRDYATAARYLRQAVAEGRGRYWAAEYLLARCELEEAPHGDNLEGERIRLEQAIQGIEDFYEAITARSELHLVEGHLKAARADAQRALALRPDYAPAHLALAWIRVQEGDLAGASDSASLARELSPDLDTRREVDRIQALRSGPSWNEPTRHESDHYVVWTDLPDRGEAFLRELEEVRELAPRVLPTLRVREGARQRKGEVFVFARPEDFYRYAYRTLGHRGENLAGVFSPRTGQLLLFESREGREQTSLVLRHEATHQWVHSLGLALPYWVNEAIATYLAGVREQHRGGFKTRDWDEQEIAVLLTERDRWLPLFDLMTQSPAEFYGGYTYLKYAQAWSFVHYCMEGDDPTLRATFLDYLDRHSKGRAGDTSGLLGVKLEHIYAETFAQHDMDRVQERWREHVRTTLADVLRDR